MLTPIPNPFPYTCTVFRDDLIRSLSAVDSKDYEGYIKLLENLANELDFRKYEAQLFELLILGRLLAPGGNLSNEGEECPLSVVGRDISEVREIAGVFEKLIRRCVFLFFLLSCSLRRTDASFPIHSDTNTFNDLSSQAPFPAFW